MADTDYASQLLGAQKAPKAQGRDYASEILTPAKAKPEGEVQAGPMDRLGALRDTAADAPALLKNALRGFWQGATDLPVGLVQLAAKLGPDKIDQAVTEYVRSRESDYQAARQADGFDQTTDIGRVAGTITASIPFGGKAAAATLPGRMLQGSKIGAALAAASPVDPGEEGADYWKQKAVQVAGGAVIGAAAPPVVEGVIKGTGMAVNAVAKFLQGLPNRLTNKATQDAIENTLTVELQKNGVDFGALTRQARDALILETQRALKAGGTIDADAIRRIADFQALGVQPTAGQISRNPSQFALERNLGKTEIGAPLAERFNEQNTRLIGVLDDARAATGSVTKDAYDAGGRVMGAVRAEDEAAKKAVKAAYDAAKAKAGIEAEVPMEGIAQRLGQIIDEFGPENIPPAVMRRLQEFGLLEGKQTKIFNIAEAEKLRKLVGNNMPGQRTPIDGALTPLKQSIDDAVNSLAQKGDVIGEEAAQAVAQARSVAAERFKKIESIPLLADMLKKKQIPPEDVVDTYILRGSVDEVKTLMGQLPPGARGDVRAAVIDWLKSKAVNGAGDTATFTQAGFNKALDDIGARNLDSIFEKTTTGNQPNILEQLRRLGRVAAAAQKAPVSSGVNYSSSATAIIDMLDKVGRLPIVGAVIGKPGDMVRATQVTRSLTPQAPVTQPAPFLTMDALDNASRSFGLAAPALGAAAVTGATRP